MHTEPLSTASRRRRMILLITLLLLTAILTTSLAEAGRVAPRCRYVMMPCSTRYPRGWGSAKSCQRQVYVCYVRAANPYSRQ